MALDAEQRRAGSAHRRPGRILRSSMQELPSFTNPPVAEVVLGAQLAQSWISGPALGALWDELRVEFPQLSSQPALQPINEQFDAGVVMQLQFGLPGVRDVLTSEDGARLVQIQADRIAYNWRKIAPDAAYPRYEAIIAPFEQLVDRVLQRCPDTAPHGQDITWAEVIYVNHIETDPQADAHRFPERILNLAAFPVLTSDVTSEDFSLARRFVLPDRAGRLYVESSSAIAGATGRKVMLLTLTARIAVDMVGDLRSALDLGHATIVRTFADITSTQFQADWGREQ
jgi:uncharacterized protein (TIGR04255 family)